MNKKLFVSIAVIAVIMLAGFTSCSPADMKAFEGILQKVDSLSGNVTVKLSDNTTMTFNLKDVDLTAIRKAVGDRDFEPGDNVTIEKDKRGDIRDIKIRYEEIQGTIKSIGTANVTTTSNNVSVTGNNVTLTTKRGDITLLVTPKTIIRGGGKDKPVFADLKVGQRVEAKYVVSSMVALTIVIDANGKIQDNRANPGNSNNVSASNQKNSGFQGDKDDKDNRDDRGRKN